MKKGWAIGLGIAALVLIVILFYSSTYNGLVREDEQVKAQMGQLNSVYQRRADLIPNLVATVQAAAVNERQTLTDVIQARSQASSVQLTPEALKDPQAFQKFEQAQGQLTGALSRLMVVVEKYPELKSQENFPILMSQLEGTENRINIERRNYNNVVQTYNQDVRRFPTSIIAGMAGFPQYPYFQAAQGAENAPKVDFGTGTRGDLMRSPHSTAPTTAPVDNAPAPNTQPHGAVRPRAVQ